MRATSVVVPLIASLAVVLAARADDGPPVTWRGAGDGHYSKGRAAAIDRIVIHTVEGTRESAVATFRSGPRKVSAHYVVGDDGSIVQCVKDEDTAFHVKGLNARSIGIEHAGYADRKDTWTRVKYEASARLARSLCEKHGIPKDRAHIIGHVEAPGATHHDPGEHFDWELYMRLVRGEEETAPEDLSSGLAPPTSSSRTTGAPSAPPAAKATPEPAANEARRASTAGMASRLGHAASSR